MTETQLNEVIARWCGWQIDEELEDGAVMGTPPGGGWDMVPDYCEDLNAMAQAEAKLDDIQYNRYCACLSKICSDDYHELRKGEHFSADPISATARQRAEALVRALGLHTEEAV